VEIDNLKQEVGCKMFRRPEATLFLELKYRWKLSWRADSPEGANCLVFVNFNCVPRNLVALVFVSLACLLTNAKAQSRFPDDTEVKVGVLLSDEAYALKSTHCNAACTKEIDLRPGLRVRFELTQRGITFVKISCRPTTCVVGDGDDRVIFSVPKLRFVTKYYYGEFQRGAELQHREYAGSVYFEVQR
jgi:hypothetical protein